MSTLFLILALLSFIFIIGASILWLIRKIMKKNTKNVIKALSIGLGVFFISIVGNIATAGMGSKSTPVAKNEETLKVEGTKTEDKKEEIKTDLGIDIDTFIKNFNSSDTVKGLGATLDKSNGKIETKDDTDRFLISVNNIDITMTLIKETEKISAIFIQSGGFGKQSTGEENIILYGHFIKGLRPDISDADILQLMGRNGWIDENLKSGQKYIINVDDITFELLPLKDKDFGTTLTIKKMQ